MSIWLRSIQLGLVSLVLGIGSVAVLDREAVMVGGFFQGYTYATLGSNPRVACHTRLESRD